MKCHKKWLIPSDTTTTALMIMKQYIQVFQITLVSSPRMSVWPHFGPNMSSFHMWVAICQQPLKSVNSSICSGPLQQKNRNAFVCEEASTSASPPSLPVVYGRTAGSRISLPFDGDTGDSWLFVTVCFHYASSSARCSTELYRSFVQGLQIRARMRGKNSTEESLFGSTRNKGAWFGFEKERDQRSLLPTDAFSTVFGVQRCSGIHKVSWKKKETEELGIAAEPVLLSCYREFSSKCALHGDHPKFVR